jgi:gliding motility-associated-like protein
VKKLFSYGLILLVQAAAMAQVNCNAGVDKQLCPNTTSTLGGSPTASGGNPPYTYSWAPSTGLSSSSAANPTVTATSSLSYTLTVHDSRDSVDTDIVIVTIDPINYMGAGPDHDVCLNNNQTILLGDWGNLNAPYTFQWTPTAAVSPAAAPMTNATPTVTTTYTLKITSPGCGIKTDEATIYVHSLNIDAGPDTSLLKGERITLEATPFDSSLVYYWQNFDGQSITYPNTYNPDVAPDDTTIYYVSVTDEWGCVYYDHLTVYVKASNVPVFYNSITPNGDGENDVWIIGNLENYPQNKLQIFNRYGQEIYSVTDYKNNWDGKYLGQNLPGGTYYYLFDTKTDMGKYKGSITIFR